MQIILNSESAKKITELREQFKDRGLKKKTWDQIISKALLNFEEYNWKKLVDQNTPEDYLIEKALNDPGDRALILEFLKKKTGAKRGPKPKEKVGQ